VLQGCRDFFHERGYVTIDSPILTPAACEGTTTLFATDYFGQTAFLAQSGQLYLEPACMAFGRVYCLGPTFRAEKSKTRRHLTEFWMVEPEVAFLELPGLLELAESFVAYLVARVLDRCADPLAFLERDTAALSRVVAPFPRMTYDEAAAILCSDEARAEMRQAEAPVFEPGQDFGAFGPSTCSRTPPIRPRRCAWTCWPPRATARSSGGPSASMITTCCSSASASTTCPSRPFAGTSTSASTGRCPTPASAWGSSAS
jgi:aspartyl-tRNA synthetase